jgi:serralysin
MRLLAFIAALCLAWPAWAQTMRNEDFVWTLGVNAHIPFVNYGYQNTATFEGNVTYLGIKFIRDSSQAPGDVTLIVTVANATGVKVLDYVAETSVSGMTTNSNTWSSFPAGMLLAVESGDEEDDSFPASLGNTLAATVSYQQNTAWPLAQSLGLPLVNLSFGENWTASNGYQGDYGCCGDLSAWCTFGNGHTYPGVGQNPAYSINFINGLALLAAASRPVATTEIGWDINNFSQPQIASYILQSAMDGLLLGDVMMVYYAFYDDGSGAWGLFNSDGTTRPAAVALHNLIALLNDSAGNARTFSTGTLGYTLAGTITGDTNVVTERSDGTYFVAVWNETVALGGATHNVTINLTTQSTTVSTYDPLVSLTAINTTANTTSATIAVADHPVFFAVGPPTSGNPTNPVLNNLPARVRLTAGATITVPGITATDTFAAGAGGNLTLQIKAGNARAGVGTKDGSGNTIAGSGAQILNLTPTWTNTLTYLANLYYIAPPLAGTDTITITLTDQASNSVVGTIPVTVNGAPQAPAIRRK